MDTSRFDSNEANTTDLVFFAPKIDAYKQEIFRELPNFISNFSPKDEFNKDASKTGSILKEIINEKSKVSLVGLDKDPSMRDLYNLNDSKVQVVEDPKDIHKVVAHIGID